MEIPVVFRKLGLATSQCIWLIDKALYGLTTLLPLIGLCIGTKRSLASSGRHRFTAEKFKEPVEKHRTRTSGGWRKWTKRQVKHTGQA